MTLQQEHHLIVRMIKDTEKEILKNTRDRIYLLAELEELFQDLSVLQNQMNFRVKVRIKKR